MVESVRFKREILGVAALLFMGSLFIVYPFLDAILLAIATSYLLRFAHDELNKRVQNDVLSTIIITTGIIGLISLTLYMFINNFFEILTGINSLSISIRQATSSLVELLQLSENFQQNIVEFINRLSAITRDRLLSIFTGIPGVLVHTGIFLVTSIYLYKDGKKIEERIYEIVNDLPDEEERIFRSLIDSIDYIFKGVFVTQFLVSLILAIIAGLGFYLISILTSPMPLIPIWAILIGLAALLPLVANFMIYLPLGTYYLIAGEPLKGSLIMAFGLIVLQIMPEVFLRPYIGSKRMNEHPLIIFTGFLAGPLSLGLKGIILGPLILILTKEFILNYTNLVSGEQM